MLKQVRICDRCSRDAPYESVYAIVGEQTLPTGETEEITEAADFCPLCLREAMQAMVHGMSWSEAANFIANYRKPLKPLPK